MQNSDTFLAPFNNPLVRLISEKKFRWLRHAMFIVIGFILGFKGDIGGNAGSRPPALQKAILSIDSWAFVVIMSMIYLLLLVLIPKLLFRSKVFLFALSFFVLISGVYFLAYFLEVYYLTPFWKELGPGFQHIELSFVNYIQLCAVATVLLGSVVGMAIFKKWIVDVKRMNELQQVNLRTELEQLKSQVNPHFLFNTLNNLLVLMKTDADRASQVLYGLSDLLRYQLYDSAKQFIFLSKDIAFIRNLLALEQIRKNDFDYTIKTDGDIDEVKLPPFLFIPFVENAVKHGASTIGYSYLTMTFRVSETHLHFTAENSKPAVKRNGIGGIGLKNIRRRLELLYPGNHALEIQDLENKYIVNLIVPL